jgi:hypothetical protein
LPLGLEPAWRRAARAAIFLMAIPALAQGGFGLPESQGLLRVRSAQTTGLGTLRGTLSHSYYYQDVGADSRFHCFQGRVGLALGLGEVGQLGLDTRLHGRLRFAAEEDAQLYDAIGESDWTAGMGDSDLSLKLILPLPFSRIRLAGEGDLRLATGDAARNLSVQTRDYEIMAILSIDILTGTAFVPTRLHLNAGRRFNRNAEGYGLAPTLDPAGGSPPFPPFYPALPPGEVIDALRQNLFGAGLEFRGKNTSLYSELSLETFYHLTDEFATRENLWQLGLGFRTQAHWRLEVFGGVDINLSKDDFDTAFEPHYPRVVTSFGISRSWQILAGDPDGDGVRGEADRCPERAEDRDGFEDEDGCPDPDNDRDGVPDVIDLAPGLPEDYDGFEDEDGRPDLDNDNDGVADRDDLCPDRPEDFDGFEDGDGCPDRLNAPGPETPGSSG